jgi:hypothetical protein
MTDPSIDLKAPDARQSARAICDEVWGATGLAATVSPADRLHVELFVEDMLDGDFATLIEEAEEKALEKAYELAEEELEDRQHEKAEELAEELAPKRAADILDELLYELPKRSQATKALKARIAKLREQGES